MNLFYVCIEDVFLKLPCSATKMLWLQSQSDKTAFRARSVNYFRHIEVNTFSNYSIDITFTFKYLAKII